MLILYYPTKEPISRHPNAILYLDKTVLYPAPYVNDIPDETWEKLKQREDVREALEDSKYFVEVVQPKTNPAMDFAERKAYLSSIKWQEIRDIANTLGITERPESGWDAAIPQILKLEFPS